MSFGEQPLMKCGCKRCTLAADGNIAAPEICNGCEPCCRRDFVRIANLQCEWIFRLRQMANGLAVAAYRLNPGRVKIRVANQGKRRS